MEIKIPVRQYIQQNFLFGGPQVMFHDAMPLITGGIIDSIGMLGLVAFIEDQFKIEFQPKEISAQGLDTVEKIEGLVRNKLVQRS
jgi:acyl carrier protein